MGPLSNSFSLSISQSSGSLLSNTSATPDSRLYSAAETGDLGLLEEAINSGADVNAANQNDDGNTALHIASRNGFLPIVNRLLQMNPSVDLPNLKSETALYLAIKGGHVEVAEELLAKNANAKAVWINEQLKNEEPLLHTACQQGDPGLVKALLDKGADVNAADLFGWTLLHNAIYHGHPKIVQMVLERGADGSAADFHGNMPLHMAIELMVCEKNQLAEAGKDVTEFNKCYMTLWRRSDVLNVLLANDVDVNAKDEDGLTPLHIASKRGDLAIVIALLDKRAYINAEDKNGLTPLHLASQEGDLAIVRALLDKGAYIDARDNRGLSPLHLAVYNRHMNVVNELLAKNATINETDRNRKTPLHIASAAGDLDCVKALLENGADVNAKDYSEFTPLINAAINEHADVVKELVANNADEKALNLDRKILLHKAAQFGDLENVKALLKKGVDVNAEDEIGRTPLLRAAITGYADVVKELFAHKADPDPKTGVSNGGPLHQAVKYGNLEVVKVLLANNANIDAVGPLGLTPLHEAVYYGHLEIVKVLLAKNANPYVVSKLGTMPFHVAVEKRNLEMVKVLLAHKVDLNAGNKEQETPLHIAVEKGYSEIVEVLLANNANPDATDTSGRTPLYLAVEKRNLKMVEVLLAHNANPDIADTLGYTSLHIAEDKHVIKKLLEKKANVDAGNRWNETPLSRAVNNGNLEKVKSLLAFNANPDVADTLQGCTPLHVAVKKGNRKIVEALLAKNADVKVQNDSGKTALQMAEEANHADIVKMLLARYAKVEAKETTSLTPLELPVQQQQRHDIAAGQSAKNGAPCMADKYQEASLKMAVEKKIQEFERKMSAKTESDAATYEAARKQLHAALAGRDLDRVRELLANKTNSSLIGSLLKIEQQKISKVLSAFDSSISLSKISFNRSYFLNVQFSNKNEASLFLKRISIVFDVLTSAEVVNSSVILPYPFPNTQINLELYFKKEKRLEERLNKLSQLFSKEIGSIISFDSQGQKKLKFSVAQNISASQTLEIPTDVLFEESEIKFNLFFSEIEHKIESAKQKEQKELIQNRKREQERLEMEQKRLELEKIREEKAERELHERQEELRRRKEEKSKIKEPLQREDNPQPKAVGGKTELHLAIQSHDHVLLSNIIFNSDKAEHLLNAPTDLGNTPLHVAAIMKNIVALELLLDLPGIDRTLRNKKGETAYEIACSKGLPRELWKSVEKEVAKEKEGEKEEESIFLSNDCDADMRDPQKATAIIRSKDAEKIDRKGSSKSAKKKEKRSEEEIKFKGAKGLRDVQDKIRGLLLDPEILGKAMFPYALASYTISGILQMEILVKERQKMSPGTDFSVILKEIAAIRNALVHHQLDEKEIDLSTQDLQDLSELILECKENFRPGNFREFTLRVKKILNAKIADLRSEDEVVDFYKEKIDRYIGDLMEAYEHLSRIHDKEVSAGSFVAANRYFIYHRRPGFQQAVTEMLCKLFECLNRSPSSFRESGHLSKQTLRSISNLREIRNRQYHECDERELPEPVEYEYSANSEYKIFKLWDEFCSQYNQQNQQNGSSSSSSSSVHKLGR